MGSVFFSSRDTPDTYSTRKAPDQMRCFNQASTKHRGTHPPSRPTLRFSLSIYSQTGQVESHPGFGRGAVRAARISKLLQDPSWTWCGFVTFFIVVAVAAILVIFLLRWTDVTAGVNKAVGWLVVVFLPAGLTILKLLLEVT